MKNFFLFLLLCVPIVALALVKQTFTLTQTFYSNYSVDAPFTSAWFDAFSGRFVIRRDWRVNEVPGLSINNYACNTKTLQTQYNLTDTQFNASCVVTPAGVLVFGSSQNISGNYIERIYLIVNNTKQLISDDNFFIDNQPGTLAIGMRADKTAFVMYQGSRTRFFLFSLGNWQEMFNNELSKLNGYNLRIVWSGSAWVLSNLGQDLWLFDGTLLTNIYGQIPTVNFSLQELVTNISGDGMILFSDKTGVAAFDNGYQGSSIIESTTTYSQDGNAIIDANLNAKDAKPSGANIRYFLSNNEANRFYETTESATQFQDKDNRLRWQALLISTNNSITPTLSSVSITYSTKDLTARNQSSRDSTRVNDLETVKGYIQSYYASVKKDPIVNVSQKQSNWKQLKDALVSWAGSLRNNSYYSSNIANYFPQEPADEDKFLYDYHSSSFGESYVLSVTLEDATNYRLQSDLDGIVLGVNCDDPVFCIGQGFPITPLPLQAQVKQPVQIQTPQLAPPLPTPYPSSAALPPTTLIRSAPLSLVRAKNDYRVYLIENGRKQWIVNPRVFKKYGFRKNRIHIISQEKLDSYFTGQNIEN